MKGGKLIVVTKIECRNSLKVREIVGQKLVRQIGLKETK